MSLINEALKKAQRQRTLDNAPLSSAPTGVAAAAVTTHVAVATRRRASLAPVWFGLGLLVLGVVSTVLIMRYGFGSDAVPTVASVPATAPANSNANSIPSPSPAPVATVPANTNAPQPVVTFTLPVSAPPEYVTNPPQPQPAPAASVTFTPLPPVVSQPAPVQTVPAVSAPAPTPVTPIAPLPAAAPQSQAEREARIYAFLSAIRLTGVRGLDRDARVLMNEKVFRLNDTVDAELGLRLSGVRPGLLTFTDAQGRTYEKRH